jgi:hypothetical protein
MALSYHSTSTAVQAAAWVEIVPAPGSGEVVVVRTIQIYNANAPAVPAMRFWLALRRAGVDWWLGYNMAPGNQAVTFNGGGIVLEYRVAGSDTLRGFANYASPVYATTNYVKDANDLALEYHNDVVQVTTNGWAEIVSAPGSGEHKILREVWVNLGNMVPAPEWGEVALNKNGTRYVLARRLAAGSPPSGARGHLSVGAAVLGATDESFDIRTPGLTSGSAEFVAFYEHYTG